MAKAKGDMIYHPAPKGSDRPGYYSTNIGKQAFNHKRTRERMQRASRKANRQ